MNRSTFCKAVLARTVLVAIAALMLHSGFAYGKSWVNVGPTPIKDYFVSSSGRVADIAVDPDDPMHWLIGAAYGGIWETYDAGAAWAPRTDDQITSAMGAIAFAPGDPKIVYAGTGEAAGAELAYAGKGLMKSVDGGTHWEMVNDKFDRMASSDIIVDPSDPNVLLIATTIGKSPGLAGAPMKLVDTGIYRSVNGGHDWVRVLDGRATDIKAHPGNFTAQYAAIGNYEGDRAEDLPNGIYRSTDAGATWEEVSGSNAWDSEQDGVGRIELAIAPSNPDVVYTLMQNSTTGKGLGVWKTENAWDVSPTWRKLPFTDNVLYGSIYYNAVISVDPEDENILYVGGANLYKWLDNQGTEIRIGGYGAGIHPDFHSLEWTNNSSSMRLIAGNDGGVYSTEDRGLTWNSHNDTLSITQFYSGTVHPTKPGLLLGGTQDNGTVLRETDDRWKHILSGDGYDALISHQNPNERWAYSSQNGRLVRTFDAGATISDAGIDPRYEGRKRRVSRYEICPHDENVVLSVILSKSGEYWTARVWRTDNFFDENVTRPTWLWNRSPLIEHEENIGMFINALAFARADNTCNTYSFATTTGKVYVTTTGGSSVDSWIDISPLPRCIASNMAFHPRNSDTIYVTCFERLIKGTGVLSGTVAWEDITPPAITQALTDDIVSTALNGILVSSYGRELLYLGTHKGVWTSPDGGVSWSYLNRGMPSVPVYKLKENEIGNVYAFTHGRSVYRLVAPRELSYLIGDKDDFHPGDPADIPPQSELALALISSRSPEDQDVNLDEGGINRPVGLTHQFTVPANATIVSASVEFSFLAAAGAYNDGILFSQPGFPIILLEDLIGQVPQAHDTYSATIDFSQVPVREENDVGIQAVRYQDLRAELSDGTFDMVFIDDVALDYSQFTIGYALPLEGDVNGDGCVDRTDARQLMNEVLGRSSVDAIYDLNGDGKYNIGDVRYMVNLFTNSRGQACN
ncbi:MAG: hypothetical protein OI74_06760 [Gammaproteobacteria bacterium (ex Lamellibrachia satsuma)]|nr:MAG: hypothetical protein HPY30_08380 [Gammaproteobacteria bacterium (ex Lamellibrachia satsuma)]RRS33756.1 MAG: hypothetical protein OI74_06760 [Gammaproteobacteria bacterium (ex Lamellibrachia satsuma)]RRS37550.1 MAG: hypothetical protein NV67_00390 [Gammaproteobacteria bacterium (ex Lamellibrachia satsuma)]